MAHDGTRVRLLADEFLNLEGGKTQIAVLQGKPALEADRIGQLGQLANLVERSETSLKEAILVYQVFDGQAVEGASYTAHLEAARAGRGREWLATKVREGKWRVNDLRADLGYARKYNPSSLDRIMSEKPASELTEVLTRHLAERPEILRGLAAHQATRRRFDEARTRVADEELRTAGVRPGLRDPDLTQPSAVGDALADLGRAKVSLRAAVSALEDVGLGAEDRDSLSAALRGVEQWTTALRRQVMGSDLDVQLHGLLDETSAS
ncbi:hypothetical protein [Geodermatophilus sp. SYSU D00815]